MSETLDLRRWLKASIEDDVAQRVAVHQQRIAALRLSGSGLALDEAASATPLTLLALGDSWFDYPLDGNGPLLEDTDIIAHLRSLGAIRPMILNVAHFGDATTDELALPKQERLIAALADPANWLGEGRPDAILMSGGGNDIAGDRFCIYLNANLPGGTGLDAKRFSGVLDSVEASYLALFALRDRYAPGAPIFAHDYDFPNPNGVHPICGGPWLKPSLDFRGWTDPAAAAAIVRNALLAFRERLVSLVADPANNVRLVETQGTLKPADWANELHPYPAGFASIAARFVTALAAHFPGRI